MRDGYIIEDLQHVVWTFFKSLSSPWNAWDHVLGYPEQEIFENFTKPIIYYCAPQISYTKMQYGGKKKNDYEMIVGIWLDRDTGGQGELNIICSKFIQMINDPQTLHTTKFTLVLGATTYTNQTLTLQGVKIFDIRGPREIIKNNDLKEFRNEIVLLIKT